jgi:hypothetical protein
MRFCGFFLDRYCRVTHLKSAIALIAIGVFPRWHVVISRADRLINFPMYSSSMHPRQLTTMKNKD